MKTILMTCLLLFLTLSCRDSKEEGSKKTTSKKESTERPKKEEPQQNKPIKRTEEEEPQEQKDETIRYTYENIFEEVILKQKLSFTLDDIKANDTIVIKASGSLFTLNFEDRYQPLSDFYPYNWIDTCRDNLKTIACPFGATYFDRFPKCAVKMRYYTGTEEESIVFSKNPSEIDLRIKVGDTLYLLEDIVLHDDELTASFQFPENIDGETNIELVSVFKSNPLIRLHVGFLGLMGFEGDCPSSKQESYRPIAYMSSIVRQGEDGLPSYDGVPDFGHITISDWAKYTVTVDVKKQEVNK